MERFKNYSPFRYEGNLLRWTDFNLPIFGNVWFVDGDDGDDGNAGDSDDTAFKTIQAGIDAASSQDTIYIKAKAPDADASEPGTYEEDLTIAYAKHGLRLIGIGPNGIGIPFFGPKIKNATAVALLTVNASGVHLENLQFNCTRNSGTYGINLTGVAGYATLAGSVGATIVNCYFKNAHATYGAVWIHGGYASTISRCTFHLGTNALGIRFSNAGVPSNGHTIESCNFKSNNGATVTLHMYIDGATEDFNVDHCNFDQATTFIQVIDGAEGLISNCCFNNGSTAVTATDNGQIDIPTACDEVGVAGCWGGDGTAVDADGA